MSLREYSGVIHLHSTYSDGAWSVERIITCGLELGLDFIILTDHDTLQPRRDGWDGWYVAGDDGPRRVERPGDRQSLLLCVGDEITPDQNHYLALGYDGPEDLSHLPPADYIREVNKRGGVGVIAHPDHRGNTRFGIGCYAWRDWSVTGYDLVDIWDLMTDWQDHLRGLPSALQAVLFPAWVLKGPKRMTLLRWDEQLRGGPAPVVGCNDNHGRPYNVFGFKVPLLPYPLALATMHTHAFCEPLGELEAAAAERRLLDCLVAGRSFIAQDYWWDSRGARVWAENPRGDRLELGATADTGDGPWTVFVELPAAARLTLVGDGRIVKRRKARRLYYTVRQPGAYRLEVHRRRLGALKPWVFTNALRFFPGGRDA